MSERAFRGSLVRAVHPERVTTRAAAGFPGVRLRRRLAAAVVCAGLLLTGAASSSAAGGTYYHLGAGTTGEWSGILARLTVRDPGVRAGTQDFVATRLLAKRESERGTVWLEAGWAETGWAGGGKQRVYTYDTNRRVWTFYDQYALAPGDQIWIAVQAAKDDVWEAWLWWRERWQLLTSQRLAMGGRAQVEQYVEVHVDGATAFDVSPIAVDNVQVKDGEALRYWRAGAVPTAPGGSAGGYCLEWATRYDTWTAGSCA